ncbi:MAG: ATP-binding cassette domain-containing protein [Gammaproteobacteria bacterium]|nr:ATP-binding cassette domain-containing protein [Gammaproteobacteria bacterium]
MLDCHIIKHRADFTVDVALRAGVHARLGIFGDSAAGKSTVLACLAGIETPDAGYIHWDGQRWYPPPCPLHQRRIGYLSQRERLFPHLTVEENVLFALDRRQRASEEVWITELRAGLGLDTLWKKPATTLSGGQVRRAALARSLCRRPPLVLLDEPFVGLDRPRIRSLCGVLCDWQARLGFTLLLVDHDPAVMRSLCETVIIMQHGRIASTCAARQLRADAQEPPEPACAD